MSNTIINIILKEAYKAYQNNEIPVGAVIVKNNKIISKSKNNRQKKKNVLGHAEINAIIKAEKKNKDWRLDGYDMYVTLEPCEMCKAIINECRISNVFYLVSQFKNSQANLKYKEIKGFEMQKQTYQKILDDFFQKLRK